jgi:glycosyltransferase involved in cell wall biosynthesis
MSQPRFSICLPTKGRSFLIGHAVRSVLAQTCKDFELIVVDNDDGDATRLAVQTFVDPRLRYIRTGGLNMQDNWERGAAEATGEYLLILEDKQMLKCTALAQLLGYIERFQPEVLRWTSDSFDDELLPARIRRGRGDGSVAMVSSDALLAGFLGDLRQGYKNTLPLPQLACLRRSVLDRIKSGTTGRLFHPVSPDVVLGLLLLNETDHVCVIQSSLVLYVSSKHSNGRSCSHKGSTGQQFLKQLPGGQADTYDHVPVKCVNVSGSIFNDFQRLRGKVEGRLMCYELNWAKYFVETFSAFLGPMATGVDMAPELAEWKRALAEQPTMVQESVRAAIATQRLKVPSNFELARKKLARALGLPQIIRTIKHLIRGRIKRDPEWLFTNPIAYYEWECKQARVADSSTERQ